MKRSYKKTWIQTVALIAVMFIAMGTNILTSPASAIVDIRAKQNAAAVMNLIDQSLGYYANATGSTYVEREHLPTSVNMTAPNMTALANATAQPIVSQAAYQIRR